ncbi:MAG: helix-turn-helix transcriptional regulator [Thiobacillus sp.]|nr:helix-turn-helix transcriptional regulator [Thiobacillus sp.]
MRWRFDWVGFVLNLFEPGTFDFPVFIHLARGMSVAQIAENLKLSPSTVCTHLYHVKQKLGANNQPELTLLARR